MIDWLGCSDIVESGWSVELEKEVGREVLGLLFFLTTYYSLLGWVKSVCRTV